MYKKGRKTNKQGGGGGVKVNNMVFCDTDKQEKILLLSEKHTIRAKKHAYKGGNAQLQKSFL